MAACIACAAASGATPAQAFRYTHSVTISGKFVDTWTRTAVGNCSLQGSGSTTVTYAWTKAWKVAPRIDPYSEAHGRWVLFILLADHNHPRPARVFSDPLALPTKTILVTDLPARLTTYTSSFAGGATPVGTDCDAQEGRPCVGRTKVRRSGLTGRDRRNLTFEATALDAPALEGVCTTGTVDGWSSTIFKNQSELIVRMPKPGTLAHRKTVVVNASDSGHQNIEWSGSQVDETVTRSLTVTFKKL